MACAGRRKGRGALSSPWRRAFASPLAREVSKVISFMPPLHQIGLLMLIRGFVFVLSLCLAGVAAAQSFSLGDLNALITNARLTESTLAAMEREISAYTPAGAAAASRQSAAQEADQLIVALENFQTERHFLVAELDSLLRTSAAIARPGGASAAITAQDEKLRVRVLSRITGLNQLNTDLGRAINASRYMLPESSALIGPNGALRAQGVARGGMASTLEKSSGAGALAPADLATLTRLRTAYLNLDRAYLSALTALYAARSRAMMVG